MNKEYRIKIYTRSANLELYRYSQGLITLPYPRVRLYGTTSDGYFYKMLADKGCDIAINIDEDAYVIDNSALRSLLEYVIENDIVCCGMNDGGVLPIRVCNPVIMNPFFNIINLKAIRAKFNIEEIEQFDYVKHKNELLQLLPDSLRNYEGLKIHKFESYYNFFFWVALNFKIMYLDVTEHSDGYTTIVYNQQHNPILMHTWWSREYGKMDSIHTSRIQAIIKESYEAQGRKVPSLWGWKCIRWFEKKSQQFSEWWVWWKKEGTGRWLISHLKKSPQYYFGRIVEKINKK